MKIFVQGISTEVGKTWASAIVVQALGSGYYKPVQSGYPTDSDTRDVKNWVTHPAVRVHEPGITLQEPLSPHAAARLEDLEIKLADIAFPQDDLLVCEAAGGLLVPLNDEELLVDLINKDNKVILVSRHYLGSINHTLLSLDYLKLRNIKTAVLFMGEENADTESVIAAHALNAGYQILGRIPHFAQMNATIVAQQAEQLRPALERFLHE